jgi:hypothetical protein
MNLYSGEADAKVSEPSPKSKQFVIDDKGNLS